MDLSPFFNKLYNVSSKTIYPSSIDDLKYKIASIIQTYFGEFHNGSLYLGVEEPVTPEELSDLISMQESDTNDYMNSIKVLGITTSLQYKNNNIKTDGKWVDYGMGLSLSDLYKKKIKNLIFVFSINFIPNLYHYEIHVMLSYPEIEDGSIILNFVYNSEEVMTINRDEYETSSIQESPKKYTGYYACDDGSMDAEVVINKFNLSWNRANVLKYIIRAGKKDPNKEIEDLEKARNYINYEIERLKERKKCH